MLSPNVRWFDDWFAIEEVAPDVIAIGEPRSHQINWNYLILGEHRAPRLARSGVADMAVRLTKLRQSNLHPAT